MKRISTFLWFEREAKDAAEFYCKVFENSRITNENPVIVAFQIEGSDFVALNGGPNHQINPSISFLYTVIQLKRRTGCGNHFQ